MQQCLLPFFSETESLLTGLIRWLQPITKKQILVLDKEWGVEADAGNLEHQGWFEVLKPIEVCLNQKRFDLTKYSC